MARSHVDQHWVAKSYLTAWCDPATPAGQEPYVWVFPADGSAEPRRRAPKRVFVEADMYTRKIVIPGVLEARDLYIEAGLSSLEDSFVRTRRQFLDRRKPIPEIPHLKLLAFVAAQQWRTPRARRHIQEQWGNVLKVMDDLKASVDRMTPDRRNSFARSQIGNRGDGPSMDHVGQAQHDPAVYDLHARLHHVGQPMHLVRLGSPQATADAPQSRPHVPDA